MTEREQAKLIGKISRDAKNGVPMKDILAKYAKDVNFNDILDVYNENSSWGAAREPIEKLRAWYDDAAKGKSVTQISEDGDIIGIINYLTEIRDSVSKDSGSVVNLYNPMSTQGKYYKSQIDLGTQVIAKLIEKNRLSDKDREFYLKQTSVSPLDIINPALYAAKIDGAITALISKLTNDPDEAAKYKEQYLSDRVEGSNQNKVKMSDPKGNIYYIDSSEVSEAVKNGWRKL